MPFSRRYEHSYGISLLDDLHNLFPEILYDPQRFQQNTLVQFMRERTAELFDVEFARNRAYYRLYLQPPSTRATTPPARPTPVTPPPIHRARYTVPLTSVPILTTTSIVGNGDQAMGDAMDLLSTAILGGLQGALQTTDLQDLLTPVPVVPSLEDISRATILSHVEPPADVVCSICQDHAPPSGSHEWRILRSCTHRFHRPCIDTWFQRNVHCPVCRHDIRDQNTT